MSFLGDLVNDVRTGIDDAEVGSRFEDNDLIHHAGLASRRVWQDLNAVSSAPVVARLEITVGTYGAYQDYYLPPSVGRVLTIGEWDTDREWWDWRHKSHSRHHPYRPGIHVMGRRLHFDKVPTTEKTLTIEYVPSGDFKPHEAVVTPGSIVLDTNGFCVTWDLISRSSEGPGTLLYGNVDDREGAYVGSLLRIWRTTPGGVDEPAEIQERTVTSHIVTEGSTVRRLEVRPAFEPVTTINEYHYELVPMYWQGVQQLIGLGTSMTLCAMTGLRDRYYLLLKEYQSAIRSEQLAAAKTTPFNKSFRRDNWKGGFR